MGNCYSSCKYEYTIRYLFSLLILPHSLSHSIFSLLSLLSPPSILTHNLFPSAPVSLALSLPARSTKLILLIWTSIKFCCINFIISQDKISYSFPRLTGFASNTGCSTLIYRYKPFQFQGQSMYPSCVVTIKNTYKMSTRGDSLHRLLPFLREYDSEYCMGTRAHGIHVGGSNSPAISTMLVIMLIVSFFIRR